ncbi:unnamed protein product [Parajaminaea phylloscopi]
MSRPAPPGGRRRAAQPNQQRQDPSDGPRSTIESDKPSASAQGMVSSDTQATVRLADNGDDEDAVQAESAAARPGALEQTRQSASENDMTQEEMEHALTGLSREDLFVALRRAKEEMDRLDLLVSSQALENESLQSVQAEMDARMQSHESSISYLNNLVAQREARIDEMTAEQEKMEDEMYKKLGSLERLRTKADEGERKLLEIERKAAEAAQAAEKEREYYQDQEALLSGQNSRLTKESNSLREEVTHLRETVHSMMEQLPEETDRTSDQQEAQDDKRSGLLPKAPVTPAKTAKGPIPITPVSRYRSPSSPQTGSITRPLATELSFEEVDAVKQELLQVKKTLSSQDAALTELRNSLSNERDRTLELEREKSELESMLTGNTLERLMKVGHTSAQTPWTQSEASETEESSAYSESEKADEEEAQDEDDVPDVPITPRNAKVVGKGRRAAGPRSSSAAHQRRKRSMDQIPEALGDELQQGGDQEERDLKAELARLRHENKNLTTYISKILNRILSMEGFERVLAADNMSGGMDSIRQAKRQGRHSVLPGMSGSADSDFKAEERKTRRQSTGLLGFARSSSGGAPESLAGKTSLPSDTGVEATNKKAHGRSSVDWRSLKLPWSSSSPAEGSAAQNPNLRPLALLSTGPRLDSEPPMDVTTSALAAPAPKGTTTVDEDEMERQRARRLLETQGHRVPDHQLTPISPRPTIHANTAGGFGAFFSRVLPSGTTATGGNPGRSASTASSQGVPNQDNSIADDSLTESLPRLSGRARPSRAGTKASTVLSGDDSRSDYDAETSFASTGGTSSRAPSRSTSLSISTRAEDLDDDEPPSGVHTARQSILNPAGDTSVTATAANSSVAGDESYAFPRHENDVNDEANRSTAAVPNPTTGGGGGWRRALKRMSLLGSETPPIATQPKAADGDAAPKTISPSPSSAASPLP